MQLWPKPASCAFRLQFVSRWLQVLVFTVYRAAMWKTHSYPKILALLFVSVFSLRLERAHGQTILIEAQDDATSATTSKETTKRIKVKSPPAALRDELASEPGVHVTTQMHGTISLRGASPEHTQVYVDGMLASDASTTTRFFVLPSSGAGQFESLRVTRGPASVTLGSGGLGGSVELTTRSTLSGKLAAVSANVASHQTARYSLGLASKSFESETPTLTHFVGLEGATSGGYSAASAHDGNREKDGFDTLNFATRFDAEVSDTFKLTATLRSSRGRVDIDNFGGPGGDDPDNSLKTESLLATAHATAQLTPILEQRIFYGYSAFQNDNTNPAPDDSSFFRFKSRANTQTLKIEETFVPNATHSTLIGAAVTREQMRQESVFGSQREKPGLYSATTYALYAEHTAQGDVARITPGVRVEQVSKGSVVEVARLQSSLRVAQNTEVSLSGGNGVRVPSLFERFSNYGDKELKAEQGWSGDIGITQRFFNNQLALTAASFYSRYSRLIEFDAQSSKYRNIGLAQITGLELASQLVMQGGKLDANGMLLRAEDLNSRTRLPRRPRLKANLNGEYSIAKVDVRASVQYVGERYDVAPEGRKRLSPYSSFNVGAAYSPLENVTTRARIENLFDKKYEEVAGYGIAGRTFDFGVQVLL